MATNIVATLAAGAIFGGALTIAGVYKPSVITSQLHLKDFHMLTVFLTGSACSAVVLLAAKRTGIAECSPRTPSSLNSSILRGYGGNVLGGLLIGVGMALTGACPGTVMVQVALGIRSGLYVLAGGILGGILWARYSSRLGANAPRSAAGKLTVHAKFDIREGQAIMAFEIVCMIVVFLTTWLKPPGAPVVHPVFGGLLIGCAQASSLLLTGKTLGVSLAYEQAGQLFWWVWGAGKTSSFPASSGLLFAVGIMVGSWALRWTEVVASAAIHGSGREVSVVNAVLGGCTMVIGARIGGGCTSGHGISGMAGLSIASIVSVASMFSGGIALSVFT